MSRGSVTPRRGKDGTITKDKHGNTSWLLKADAPRDPVTGERLQKYKTVRARTKGDAQKQLTKFMREIDTGDHIDRDAISLRQYADAWLQDVAPRKAKAGRTRERYGELLQLYVYPTLGKVKIQGVSGAMVDKLYGDLRRAGGKGGRELSDRTVFHVHRLLSEVLRKAVKAKVINSNPCDAAEAPSPGRTPAQAFRPEDVETILKALEGRALLPVVQVALVTGARRGELAGLRWSDIDFERRTLSVQRSIEKVTRIADAAQPDKSKWLVWTGQTGAKTEAVLATKSAKTDKSNRTIRLGESEVGLLRDHYMRQKETWLKLGVRITEGDYVFPATPDRDHLRGQAPQPTDPDRFTQNFAKVLERLALKRKGLSFHSLRHTNASLLLWKKVDDKVVARRIGHSSTKLTRDTYQHIIDEMDDVAADVASSFLDPVAKKPSA